MLSKKLLLLTLIVLISLFPSFSEKVTREFTITAVLPNTSGGETYSISVVDIRDGMISNAINEGETIELGRAVDMLTGYKDMFAIDYTSNSTGPVTITVTLSPARKEDDSSYIKYDYKCTPSMVFSSSDLTELTPGDEWIKDDGVAYFYGYSLELPTENLENTIASSEVTNAYKFIVEENYYTWVDEPWWEGNDDHFDIGESISDRLIDGNTLSRRLSFAFKLDYDSYVAATKPDNSGVYFIGVTIGVEAE